jgi:hypothetical protein
MLALSLAALAPRCALAQGWRETQLWSVATMSRPAVMAAGFGLAWRDAGRTRIGVALAAGAADGGRAAGRGEIAWHFLLDPARRSGLSVYSGGGLAVTAVRAATVRPFIQAVIGVETSPAAAHGFFIEAGFGGAARVAAGWRWRSRRGK